MPLLNKIGRTLIGRNSTGSDPADGDRAPGDAAGSGPAGGGATARDLSRLRVALTVFFALDGFVFAGWVVRIPAIKEQVGASPAELGMALLGVSAGAVLTMVLTGRLCTRFGSHPLTVVCGAVLALSVALPPLTHSALALGLVLLVFGTAYGGLNVAMNSAAVDLVAALRRPVMSTFHAAFSLGGLIGAGLGALVAPHLSPTRHLLLLTAAGLAATAAAGRMLLRTPAPAPPARGRIRGRGPAAEHGSEGAPPEAPEAAGPARDRSRGTAAKRGARGGTPEKGSALVVMFGLIALCDAYGEGALADWGALHIEQDLHTGPGLAAAGFAAYSLAMTAGRLAGTWLLERAGQTAVLVGGGLTAAAGMLVGALAPQTWLVVTGYAVTGLGLSNIFPTAIARAGALAGARGVATASTFGYSGMLLGPPAIGFLAGQAGLPTALTTVPLLAGLAAAAAYAVRGSAPERSAPQSAHADERAPGSPAPGG